MKRLMMMLVVAALLAAPRWAMARDIFSSVSCVIKGEDTDTVLRALSDTFQIPHQVKSRPKDY